MKRLSWFAFGFTAVVLMMVVILAVMTRNTLARRPAQPRVSAPETVAATASRAPSAQAVSPTPPARPAIEQPRPSAPEALTVRLNSAQVLATVNGTEIKLADLVALPQPADAVERRMSKEMYEFLLQRAVERELVFQAAQKERIELSPVQQGRLEAARSKAENTEGAFDLQPGPEQSYFEQRDFKGLLLLGSLVERAGVAAPYPTQQQVEAYQRTHPGEKDAEIRVKLADELRSEYDREVRAYLERLKSNAAINVNKRLS